MTNQTNNTPEVTSTVIQAYSIFEYTQKIQQAISEGYYFELDTNEGTPQQFGFHYEVTMYKKPTTHLDKQSITVNVTLEPELKDYIDNAITEVKELQKEQETKVQPQKQRGRPIAK